MSIPIPTGSYETSDLEMVIKRTMPDKEITFNLKTNNIILKREN